MVRTCVRPVRPPSSEQGTPATTSLRLAPTHLQANGPSIVKTTMTSADGVALLGWLSHEGLDGPLPLHAQVSNYWWWKQHPEQHAKDASSLLIFTSLVIGGVTFLILWWNLKDKTSSDMHFFHPGLSFSLAVPIFGFLGSLLFVMDVFLKGKEDTNTCMEFVLRLVLGPYVAIVMVLLFRNTFNFIQISKNSKRST